MSPRDRLLSAIAEQVSLEEMRRLYVDYIYEMAGRNQSEAARRLKIDRRTIQRWGKDGR